MPELNKVGVDEHTGGVDHPWIGGLGGGAEGPEDLGFEGLARGIDRLPLQLAVDDPLTEGLYRGSTRVHHGCATMRRDGAAERGRLEQTMNRGNAAV